MIITLVNADFKDSNIGTLTTWMISRILGDGATYDGVPYVEKGAAFSATVTISDGYSIGSDGVTVTMGGETQTSVATTSEDGKTITIEIAEVTGNVEIRVPTIAEETEEPETPVYYTITYKYVDSEGNTIKDDTTESVVAGTSKTFATSNADAIDGYTIASVDPVSATINANTTVTYTYTINESSGDGTETDISSRFIEAGFTAGAIYADSENANFGGAHSSQTSYYANGANTAYVDISDFVGKTLKITMPFATQTSHTAYGITFYTATGKANAISGETITYTDGSVGAEIREVVIPTNAKYARTTWLTPENETAIGIEFSAKIVS